MGCCCGAVAWRGAAGGVAAWLLLLVEVVAVRPPLTPDDADAGS